MLSFWSSQTEVRIDARVVPLTGTLLDTLRADAGARIPCAASQMTSKWVELGSPHTPFTAAMAEGCGQRLVYSFEAPYGALEHIQLYTLSQVSLAQVSR